MTKLKNPDSQTEAPSALLAEPPTLQVLPILRSSTEEDGRSALPVPRSTLAAPKHSEGGRKIRRNGRIACLPKVQRDLVNHMLWNAVPYKNIVAALDEAGFTVTERNISNWATGGYLEWSLAQEHVLQNRLNQDQMLDFLRRDDAPEVPEVGLQAAATRLSQVLLQKLARAEDPEAQLSKPAVSPTSKSAGCGNIPGAASLEASAGLEIRDTAGLETCATTSAPANQPQNPTPTPLPPEAVR